MRLLEIFERVHDAGFTYNDLKLDNILIGDASQSAFSMHEIRLVDFGFAQKYMDRDGQHLN